MSTAIDRAPVRGRELSRRARAASLLAVAALLLPVLHPGPATASIPPHAAPANTDAVRLQVTDITPSSVPQRSNLRTPLQITLDITNTTDSPVPKVEIRADRGDPIGTQTALNGSLSSAKPASTGLPVPPTKPVVVSLTANSRTTVTFTTSTSLLNDGKGLCLCHNQVYPLVLSAHVIGTDGSDQRLGAVTTYVTSVYQQPAHPVRVAWVWPLIDRPHRLVEDTIFTDDDLAASVDGGRLDRSLQVVEQAPAAVPMTLVVDPELLDELEVMAAGRYTIQVPGGKVGRPGTGQVAAEKWLKRFATVLNSRPTSVSVTLTPYGDPDMSTLSESKLSWTTPLPPPMDQRVAQALSGRRVQNTIAWPPSGAIDPRTLTALATDGTTTVIIDSSSVSPSSTDNVPASLTRVRAGNATMTAVLTAPALQTRVARAVLLGGAAQLPSLSAELAARAFQDPKVGQAVVLTPPRYIDPNVLAAVRTIRETSVSPISTPVSVATLAGEPPASSTTSKLRDLSSRRPELPSEVVTHINGLTGDVSVLTELFARGAAAQPVLTALPHAIQRLASAAWRPGVGPFEANLGTHYADRVATRVQALLDGVRIVKPSTGSYTLASSTAKLPITVQNTGVYPVHVKVAVSAQDAIPGYTSPGSGSKTVPPGTKLIIQVPSRVERSGRIAVQAQLQTSSGQALGPPVKLFVHSTIFGLIGIVITVVAGSILVLALLVRFGRRIRSRRRARNTSSVEPVTRGVAA